MIDKNMCEPKEARTGSIYHGFFRLAGAISFALAAAYQFGLVGWLSVYGLYLYIEGLHNDRV